MTTITTNNLIRQKAQDYVHVIDRSMNVDRKIDKEDLRKLK